MSKDSKWFIFDLDGTLADIETRRRLCTKDDGKMDWNKFFDPKNIKLDEPKQDVIMMFQALKALGHKIAIFSGRSASTKQATFDWLEKHGVGDWDLLKLRPEKHPFKFMPDDKLKLQWFEQTFVEPENMSETEVVAVFDDRDKVVKMWREIGLTCMQVAPGNF